MSGTPDIEEIPDLDFGIALGASQGVVAYSNLDSYYFSGEKHFCQGVFTGFKYQCVEYARRHMLLTTGFIFGQCGPAHEIFDMDKVTDVCTKKDHKWHACPNGKTSVKPKAGMTMVYPIDKKMPVGHVAVIGEVGEDWVGIAEENEASKPWNGKSYGRKVPLRHDTENDTWTIVEPDQHFVPCRGWLYIDGDVEPLKPLAGVTEADMTSINHKTTHELIYPKHTVCQDLIEEHQGPKKLARFETPSLVPEVPLQTAEDTPSTRMPLLAEYLRILAAGSEQLKDGEFDDGGVNYSQYGLSGIKRRQEISTVYSPNMEIGVASIGQSMRGFRLVETFMQYLFSGKSGLTKEDIAIRYNMPVEMVDIAKAAFDADTSNSSAALSQVDFALGTMGLVYDAEGDSFRLLHTEFDSLPYLMDMNAFQEPYTHRKAKITQCWIMTSYGYDFHRAVRNFQKYKLHNKKANEVMYSIDFGSVEDLKARGLTFSGGADEEYAYGVERLNHLYNIEYMKEVLVEKQKEFDNGDIPDEDLPKWSIQSINFFDEQIVNLDALTGKVFVNGQEAKLMWKCSSWKFIFDLAKSNTRVDVFVTKVAAVNIGVFQPAWTHIAAQSRFLYDLSVWAETLPADQELEDIGFPLKFVIPSKNWEKGPDGPCTAVFRAPITKTNPTLNGEAYVKAIVEEEVGGAKEGPVPTQVSYAAMHCLLAGGKRSAGLWLESKTNEKDIGGVTMTSTVHPSPAAFVRAAVGFDEDSKQEF